MNSMAKEPSDPTDVRQERLVSDRALFGFLREFLAI
jgi:hypothetical protein